MDTAAEKIVRRDTVAREHATARATLSKQYRQDKQDLENTYLAALKANREELEDAFRDADLNPDGSDPQERPQG